MARILVVDDDEGITTIVARTLRPSHTVIIAHQGREGIQLLQRQRPDAVILDILMPFVDGIQVCRFIRTNPVLASVPILFLTSKEEISDKIAGFEAGADDYLTKPFDPRELELRVVALLRHASQLAPTGILTMGDLTLDPDESSVHLSGRKVELTEVEFELLYYLVAHTGQVIPAEQLLRDVWGYPPGTGSPSLVRMHVLNVRRKIEADPSHPQYLCTVSRHGYTLRLPVPAKDSPAS